MDAKTVAELRKKTGAGMMDCKKALVETNGDMEKAVEILRKKGMEKADKKGDRETREGLVVSYIHSNNKIGAMIELLCETDFVARTEDFQNLANDIAMHVVASNPLYLHAEEIPQEVLDKEKEIYVSQMKEEGKADDIIEKIVEGKMQKYAQEICLLDQAFIKDDKKTIRDLVKESIGTIGENIELRKFVRFEI